MDDSLPFAYLCDLNTDDHHSIAISKVIVLQYCFLALFHMLQNVCHSSVQVVTYVKCVCILLNITFLQILYIVNHSRKKTFANFTDFGMIVNVFLLPFSIF